MPCLHVPKSPDASPCADCPGLSDERPKEFLSAISQHVQPFAPSKLRMSDEHSLQATEDAFFLKQPSSKQSRYVRWVLACKFVIASNLRMDCYDVLGMQRNRIPENVHFFVDDQLNLCAYIESDESEEITQSILQHCDELGTAVTQTYLSDKGDGRVVNVVRIPMTYYQRQMDDSFYALCCRFAKRLQTKHDYASPLFLLLHQNIAHLDCFQSSVPMVPLRGSLSEMFCRFALGVYDHEEAQDASLSLPQFVAFLGAFDCWREMQRRDACRQRVRRSWAEAVGRRQSDVNIMQTVVGFAGLAEMDDDEMEQHVNAFSTDSAAYESYVDELNTQLPSLECFVDF